MKNAHVPMQSQRANPLSLSGMGSEWRSSAEGSQQMEQIRKEKTKMAQDLYPVPEDQVKLNELLKQIKIRMQNTQAWYGGEQHTLWKLADMLEQGNNQINSYLQFSNSGEDL